MTHKLNILTIAIVFAMLVTAVSLYGFAWKADAGTSSLNSYPCTNVTASSVVIGNQKSTQVIASSSRRAWTRIEQPVNATNTVAISIAGDAPAVIGSGVEITSATTTSPVPFFEFGLNANPPYVGAAQAITDIGSTTILVTQCTY